MKNGLFETLAGAVLVAIPTPATTPIGLALIVDGVKSIAEDLKD